MKIKEQRKNTIEINFMIFYTFTLLTSGGGLIT